MQDPVIEVRTAGERDKGTGRRLDLRSRGGRGRWRRRGGESQRGVEASGGGRRIESIGIGGIVKPR